jgi:hypothetical protein
MFSMVMMSDEEQTSNGQAELLLRSLAFIILAHYYFSGV